MRKGKQKAPDNEDDEDVKGKRKERLGDDDEAEPQETHPTTFAPNLPLVNDLITPGIKAGLAEATDPATKLQLVFIRIYRNFEWKKRINPRFEQFDYCEEIIKVNKELGDIIDECAACGNWSLLFDRKPYLWKGRSSSPPNTSVMSDQLEAFQRAFETKYQAWYPDILLTTMDLYTSMKEGDYYNRSMSIVQSSGTGKSRLVHHTATLRFTFPFNLHEQLPGGSHAYPPFDDNVRDYLIENHSSDELGLIRFFAFLEALFKLALIELRGFKKGTPQEIARAWYKLMHIGEKAMTVGTKRSEFYDRVIEHAKELERLYFSPESEEAYDIAARSKNMIDAFDAFRGRLIKLHGPVNDKFLAIVYFDEAHTLHAESKINPNAQGRNPYFALMHVLTAIQHKPIFFLFLSTNTSLSAFAPTNSQYPSLRVQAGGKLIPPFTELPYDTFSRNFTSDITSHGTLTLNKVCELDQIVKFGRPMWYSHYINTRSGNIPEQLTIKLAMMKLGSKNFAKDQHAQLAALDCRVLIQFDPIHANSRSEQATLVQSYMRTVFTIPETRDYMWSGYPSEPILAEAAARLLNESPGNIIKNAPEILERASNVSFLARGERGELVARTLITVAHDLAIMSQEAEGGEVGRIGPRFHRPVRLLDLLQHYLAPSIWEVVRNTLPVHAYAGDPTLEHAFRDIWINFSHFVQLGDHESFCLEFAFELLKRGAAIQTFECQANQDFALPTFFGDPDRAPLTVEDTSYVQVQVKNVAAPTRVVPDPSLISGGKGKLPILSIVNQLGAEKEDGHRVSILSTQKDAHFTRSIGQDNIERRHYVVELFGCTSQTYKCIPEDSAAYHSILKGPKAFEDFSRLDYEPNRDSLYASKPVVYDRPGICTSWTT